MNSPHTGKPMKQLFRPVSMEFKGDHFMISWLHYFCPESEEEFTDELLDDLNRLQVYYQYAQKHNIPLEQVMPNSKPVIKIIIEKTKDHYSAYADNVEGVYGAGATILEAKESIKKSIKLIKEFASAEYIPEILKGEYTLEFVDDELDLDKYCTNLLEWARHKGYAPSLKGWLSLCDGSENITSQHLYRKYLYEVYKASTKDEQRTEST